MVARSLAGSENRLISFFQRTKALLTEAEQWIYVFSSVGDIDRIDMLHERLSEAGETVFILKERAAELVCSDRDLEIMTVTPGIGQTRMLGALHSRGIRVQRWKVREVMPELDPVGTILRWRGTICRRKYSVRSPMRFGTLMEIIR